jgi:hypothetical protein
MGLVGHVAVGVIWSEQQNFPKFWVNETDVRVTASRTEFSCSYRSFPGFIVREVYNALQFSKGPVFISYFPYLHFIPFRSAKVFFPLPSPYSILLPFSSHLCFLLSSPSAFPSHLLYLPFTPITVSKP